MEEGGAIIKRLANVTSIERTAEFAASCCAFTVALATAGATGGASIPIAAGLTMLAKGVGLNYLFGKSAPTIETQVKTIRKAVYDDLVVFAEKENVSEATIDSALLAMDKVLARHLPTTEDVVDWNTDPDLIADKVLESLAADDSKDYEGLLFGKDSVWDETLRRVVAGSFRAARSHRAYWESIEPQVFQEMLTRLSLMDGKLDDIYAFLLKKFGNLHPEELEEIQATVRELKKGLAWHEDAILRLLGQLEMDDIAPEDFPKIIRDAESAIKGLKEEIAALRDGGNQPPTDEYDKVLQQAEALIDEGDIDQAEAVLNAIRSELNQDHLAATLKSARHLVLLSKAARARADILEAAYFLGEAAALIEPHDWEQTFGWYYQAASECHDRSRISSNKTYLDHSYHYCLLAMGVSGETKPLLPWPTLQPGKEAKWAQACNLLGTTLRILGERGDDKALSASVDTYNAALEVRTRQAMPLDWAMTTANLGKTLYALGDYEAARRLFCEALQFFRKQHAPAYLATIESMMRKRGIDPDTCD